jgi:ABC-2 type transport system ATP-binding protein
LARPVPLVVIDTIPLALGASRAALLGLCFGSFVTLASYRLLRREPILMGRSQCPSCRAALGIRDLVPVLSWLMSRRQCRHCAAPVSPRYALIELLLGAMFVGLYLDLGATPAIILLAALAVGLVTLSVTDLETGIIPDMVLLVVAPLGVVYQYLTGDVVLGLIGGGFAGAVEISGLIGLNGVGKTTLIKSILTLVKPTVGTVRIFGEDHKRPVSRAKLAYLPEKFQPPPLLTGAEFVRFSLSYYGVKFDRAAASEMANNLGLEDDALDKRVGVYSKGMSQKLGLLATFMTELPLLMRDEPMSGLDPKARILLKRQVEIYHRRGNTVFLSSHILADLDEMCDRVGVLHNGRLAYDGTPAALQEAGGLAVPRARVPWCH